jgi:hypothetical protein
MRSGGTGSKREQQDEHLYPAGAQPLPGRQRVTQREHEKNE